MSANAQGEPSFRQSVDLMFNRAVALMDRIPYFTTAAGAVAAAAAIRSREEGDVRVRTLQG